MLACDNFVLKIISNVLKQVPILRTASQQMPKSYSYLRWYLHSEGQRLYLNHTSRQRIAEHKEKIKHKITAIRKAKGTQTTNEYSIQHVNKNCSNYVFGNKLHVRVMST